MDDGWTDDGVIVIQNYWNRIGGLLKENSALYKVKIKENVSNSEHETQCLLSYNTVTYIR